MTDAREIIAQVFRRAHRDACYPDASTGECEIAASVIVASLTAAGFRILGPDEVKTGDELVAALESYGFPVSDAAEPALMEGGSGEAKALHTAAKAFIAGRQALATSKGGER